MGSSFQNLCEITIVGKRAILKLLFKRVKLTVHKSVPAAEEMFVHLKCVSLRKRETVTRQRRTFAKKCKQCALRPGNDYIAIIAMQCIDS